MSGPTFNLNGKVIPVRALSEARAKWIELRDADGLGASDMEEGCGEYRMGERLVAVVHYNGRIETFFPGLAVGQRVRFLHDTDRYPHFIIPAGREGTITEVSRDPGTSGVVIKVDGPDIPGLHDDDEWPGEFQWAIDDEIECLPRAFVVVDPIDGRVLVDEYGKAVSQ